MPVAGAGAVNTLAKVWKAAKFGAGIGLATELAIQPSVFEFKKDIGVEYGLDDAALNVTASTVGSALLMGTGEALKPVARSGARVMAEGYRKFFDRRPDLVTPDTEAALQVLDDIADMLESNPLSGGAEAQNAHVNAIAKAVEDLQNGRRVDVADIVGQHEQALKSFIPHTLDDTDPRLRSTHEISTPERNALRLKKVEEQFKDVTPVAGRKPIAYVMGGGGGAGKGTILKTLRDKGIIPKKGALHVDPDKIKASLDEYKALAAVRDGRAAQAVHKESSNIAKAAYEKGLAEKVDMIVDKTLGNPEKAMALINSLKASGYEVRLFGVAIDPSEGARRSILRGRKNMRFVPLGDLVKAHRGFAGGFQRYADAVDELTLFDNTGKKYKQIARKKPGGKLEIQDRFNYNMFVRRRFPDDIPHEKPRKRRSDASASDAGSDRDIGRGNGGSTEGTGRRTRTDADADTLAGGRRLDPEQAELDEVDRLLTELGDDFEVPVDVRATDASGKLEVTTRPARELLDDLNEKESTLQNIITCVMGGAHG